MKNPQPPPQVALTAPASNSQAIAPASVTLSANASDSDGQVTKVEFLLSGSVVATVTTPPYTTTRAGLVTTPLRDRFGIPVRLQFYSVDELEQVIRRAARLLELDLTDAAPGSVLEILIHPAPKRPGFPADRSQASATAKPPVSYGWDWHPRLIPLGLCDELRFEIRPAVPDNKCEAV